MAVNWSQRIPAFCRSPRSFICGTTAEHFLEELLRELRDDRESYTVKVVLLSPLCEHPQLLCPSSSMGEETVLELMSVFIQCSPKSVPFRCQLLVSITSVLVCTSCVSWCSCACQDFLELLFQLIQDTDARPVRAAACDCLRELEACVPGLLSQQLELLSGLRQQEASGLHQAFAQLHALVLRNAVYLLTREPGAGAKELKALLDGNSSVTCEAQPDPGEERDPGPLRSLTPGPMGSAPALHTGPNCKELRTALAALLEESYLLTPLSQCTLLHTLTEVVTMVTGITPAVLRTQLLRLLGTTEVCLLHTTLLMKGAFTDSLFSAEDEAFMLRRLVVLSQHPLLTPPEKLFYMDCLLHFPENRPIGCGDADEGPPVLLTPQLVAALVPTVFDDGASMLARVNLLSLVYLENGEEGDGEEGRVLAYLYEHLLSLIRIVENGGSSDVVATFFRATFLFLFYFCHVRHYSERLMELLRDLYLGHAHLAPCLINLADRTRDRLPDSTWTLGMLTALQTGITERPLVTLTLSDLSWHLKVLGRVAEEVDAPQPNTLRFLSSVVMRSSSSLCVNGNWRLGNSVLAVCSRLLVHPSLDSLLIPLADILQYLACRYGDADVQDHARLYYTLLTTLSKEKLARMLAQGTALEGWEVKKRTLSSIVAESEGLASVLSVHRTDKHVFRLVEMQQRQDADPVGYSDSDQTSVVLEAYRAQFERPDLDPEIILNYQLVLTEDPDTRFDRIFSVHLHFTLTDDHYEELSDLTAPCLFRARPSPVVMLRLKPRRPYPTTLRVGAVFTTQDGLCWHTFLPDVHVAFRQTFLAPPTPLTWGLNAKLKVFEGLWDQICGDREEDGAENATSLFCSRLQMDTLAALVHKHFLPYVVSNPSDKDQVKVLIFLPPRSHTLLKIRPMGDVVHFHIATDNWQLLPHISSFLSTVT